MQTLCPEFGLRTAPNWQEIRKMTMTSQFDVVFFLLSSLVTGSSFMSISSLVLELRQFSFTRDWPEIRKSEIPSSEFYPISGDWRRLWVPHLTRMSLIECYWMLQNSRVTAFTVLELLRETNWGGGGVKLPSPPLPIQIRVKGIRVRYAAPITLLSIFRGTVRMD